VVHCILLIVGSYKWASLNRAAMTPSTVDLVHHLEVTLDLGVLSMRIVSLIDKLARGECQQGLRISGGRKNEESLNLRMAWNI